MERSMSPVGLGAFCVALAVTGPAFLPTAVRADAKVQVCHRPPGNPNNYQTITIGESALRAHLAHGDFPNACLSDCDQICDDKNKCTHPDGFPDFSTGLCVCSPSPVNCDDSNSCTADSCDPATGCINTPLLGTACDDGQVCTGPDTCTSAGQCVGAATPNCCIADSQCASPDLCTTASCNLGTNRCVFQAEVCTPPDLCSVATCNPTNGACVTVAKDCSDNDPTTTDACDPTTGNCTHTATGPSGSVNGTGTAGPSDCNSTTSVNVHIMPDGSAAGEFFKTVPAGNACGDQYVGSYKATPLCLTVNTADNTATFTGAMFDQTGFYATGAPGGTAFTFTSLTFRDVDPTGPDAFGGTGAWFYNYNPNCTEQGTPNVLIQGDFEISP
jgi:hypothetical protein